jgi:hypothetical protein
MFTSSLVERHCFSSRMQINASVAHAVKATCVRVAGVALASRRAECVIPGEERQMTTKDQIGGTGTEIETGSAQNGRARPAQRGIASRALSAIEARQGVISGRVVTVLGVSLALTLTGIVLAFVMAS